MADSAAAPVPVPHAAPRGRASSVFGLLPVLGGLPPARRARGPGSSAARRRGTPRSRARCSSRGDAVAPRAQRRAPPREAAVHVLGADGVLRRVGVNEVAARLPSLLAALLTVLTVAGAARRLAPPGDRPAGGRGRRGCRSSSARCRRSCSSRRPHGLDRSGSSSARRSPAWRCSRPTAPAAGRASVGSSRGTRRSASASS